MHSLCNCLENTESHSSVPCKRSHRENVKLGNVIAGNCDGMSKRMTPGTAITLRVSIEVASLGELDRKLARKLDALDSEAPSPNRETRPRLQHDGPGQSRPSLNRFGPCHTRHTRVKPRLGKSPTSLALYFVHGVPRAPYRLGHSHPGSTDGWRSQPRAETMPQSTYNGVTGQGETPHRQRRKGYWVANC